MSDKPEPGRIVVVTGGASHGEEGLGSTFSRHFAAQGDRVAIWDINLAAAQALAEEIKQAGGSASAFEVDVSSYEAVREAASKTRAEMGIPTVLVNSVGIRDLYPFLKVPPERWRKVMSVNLDGTFYCCLEIGKQMAEARRGIIVNIGSPAGQQGHPVRAAYVSSKHGLVGLTRSAAMDLAKYGIRVNCISVAGGSAFHKHNQPPGSMTSGGNMNWVPLESFTDAQKSAEIVYFYTTEATSLCTGAFVMVDGGMTIVGDADWRRQVEYFEEYYDKV